MDHEPTPEPSEKDPNDSEKGSNDSSSSVDLPTDGVSFTGPKVCYVVTCVAPGRGGSHVCAAAGRASTNPGRTSTSASKGTLGVFLLTREAS